jgi:hypothetical protein
MFLSHPQAVGETYGQHMRAALGFAGALFLASLACLVHAFAPFLFTHTGSQAVRRLYERLRATGRLLDIRSTSDTTVVADAPASLTV